MFNKLKNLLKKKEPKKEYYCAPEIRKSPIHTEEIRARVAIPYSVYNEILAAGDISNLKDSVKEELSRQLAWEIMNYIEVQADTEYITSSKVFHGRIRILREDK